MPTTKRPSQLLAEQIEKLQTEQFKTAKAEFAAGFKDLFASYPRLKSVSWSGSFEYNDEGGTDWYSSHEDCAINGFDYSGDDETGDEGPDRGENLHELADQGDKEAKQIIKDLRAFLSSFDDDFYEERFADQESVTVTRKGVSND